MVIVSPGGHPDSLDSGLLRFGPLSRLEVNGGDPLPVVPGDGGGAQLHGHRKVLHRGDEGPHQGPWSDPSSAAEDNDDNDDTQNNFEADAQFQAVTRNVSPKIINSG